MIINLIRVTHTNNDKLFTKVLFNLSTSNSGFPVFKLRIAHFERATAIWVNFIFSLQIIIKMQSS